MTDPELFSHLHWDHVGDPEPFVNAEIVVGSDCKVLLEDAYPINPESPFMPFPQNMPADFIDFADPKVDRKSTRLNSSHSGESRMPSSA